MRLDFSGRVALVLFAVLAGAMSGGLGAAVRYVSAEGANSNPGTFAEPFRTIEHALRQSSAGDEVVVRGGVYREAIVPNRSGTAEAPIIVRPHFDGSVFESVELRGLVRIVENTGGVGAWQMHDAERRIYRIQLNSDWDLRVGAQSAPSNQVFANGEILIEARWPNIASYSNMRETDWALGRGTYSGSGNPYAGTYTADGLGAFAPGQLAGAMLVFSPGQRWFVQTATVSGNSGSTLQFLFDRHPFEVGFHLPDDGDRFFLTKSLALLDAPGEWFFDTGTHVLYLRMPDDSNPSGQTIEMRRHDRFLDLSGSNYIRFENLRFKAAFIFSGANNHGFVFDGCHFEHLTNGIGRNGLFLNGNHNQVLNSTFLGDAGTPIHLRDGTAGNIVENNVVGDAQYLVGYGTALQVRGAQRVRHNTVFNAGGHGISVSGPGAVVERNRVYHFGSLVQDVGGINAFGGGNQGGARWSHNIVHDGLAGYGDFPGNNGTHGIRIDNGGATRAFYNVVIDHNLVWGVTNSAFNIWGVQDSQLAPGDTQASVNIRLLNNTAIGPSKMVGRSDRGFRFTGITWQNNLLDGLLSGSNNDSLSTATIRNNLLRSNVIASNTTGVASFANAADGDYQLQAGSPGVDAGVLLPPYTDHVTDGAPDLGAFERGQLPWRAGAVITAAHLKDLRLIREDENSLVLRGLPIGRTVPDGFRVRLGGSRLSSPNPTVSTSLDTHLTEVHLAIDLAGLTGNQLIEYSLDGTTFLNPGQFVNVSEDGGDTLEAPGPLSFYAPSNDSVTLLWRDNSRNEESFEIQVSTDLNFSADFQSISVPANENVHVFTGLTPDKTYHFRVQAKNSVLGDSVYSPVTSTRIGRMGFSMRHPDDDGTEFAIAFNPVALNGTHALITINDPAVTALRFAGLPIPSGATILGANLQFKTGVQYVNTVARVRFRGERVPDSAPLVAQAFNLRNRLSTATTALVPWNDIPPWYQDEVTQRQMSPDLSAIVQEIVSLPGWQAGNALTFLVQDNGSSSWEASRSFSTADDSLSNTTLFVRYTTPPAPTLAVSNLVAAASGQEGIALSWSYAGSGHTGFRVERSLSGTRRFDAIATVAADVSNFNDTGLNPGTIYHYRVRALNSGGIGPASNLASASTLGNRLSTILQNSVSDWHHGQLGSAPPASLTVGAGGELVHFTGGSGWVHDHYAQFWRHFDPVALTDGQTLRLRVTFAYTNDGTRPNIDRALRFALLNSNGSQATANINANNSPEQRNDSGYGIALGSGSNTTSRYIEERPGETESAPLRTEMRGLGANTGAWSANDASDHTLVLDLRREGADLHILATLDGVPFDGGRIVTDAHTLTFDTLMLANRTRGVTWVVRSLVLETLTPVPALSPLESWRLQKFGTHIPEGRAADHADPDGDGVPNLLEYALGGDPLDSASRPSPETRIQDRKLQLSFTPAVTEGLRFFVEASSDLETWTSTEITPLVVAGQSYTHTDTGEAGGAAPRFLRLRVR